MFHIFISEVTWLSVVTKAFPVSPTDSTMDAVAGGIETTVNAPKTVVVSESDCDLF